MFARSTPPSRFDGEADVPRIGGMCHSAACAGSTGGVRNRIAEALIRA